MITNRVYEDCDFVDVCWVEAARRRRRRRCRRQRAYVRRRANHRFEQRDDMQRGLDVHQRRATTSTKIVTRWTERGEAA